MAADGPDFRSELPHPVNDLALVLITPASLPYTPHQMFP
jgi:hypothetical protein